MCVINTRVCDREKDISTRTGMNSLMTGASCGNVLLKRGRGCACVPVLVLNNVIVMRYGAHSCLNGVTSTVTVVYYNTADTCKRGH